MSLVEVSGKELEIALKPLSEEQLETLSKKDLIILLKGEQGILKQFEEFLKKLTVEKMNLEGRMIVLKSRLFAPSSEKSSSILKNNEKTDLVSDPSQSDGDKKKKVKKSLQRRKLLPSERYPHAMIKERHIYLENPNCNCCHSEMEESKMTEVRERLTVISKKFMIERDIYHKCGCPKCHGDIQTPPTIPQVVPGGVYSDDFIIDLAVSKFFDLIPIERYVSMAKQQGFMGLPPHSLIMQTHQLAFYLLGVYKDIGKEVQESWLTYADETPHKMLEGDEKQNWYLWQFSTPTSCYFECHNTRSGDVASDFLSNSNLRFLMSDVYQGYGKAIRICNEKRKELRLPEILSLYCNAHARRKFKEALGNAQEAEYFIILYKKIYALESQILHVSKSRSKKIRRAIRRIMNKMRKKAERYLNHFPTGNLFYIACNYFVKNFKGLSLFTFHANLPIDNNHAERMLRSPVVGRKTWYGTHSKQGAETAAILFSIMQSCKLNKINPREYLAAVIKSLHETRKGFTPYQYKIKRLTC